MRMIRGWAVALCALALAACASTGAVQNGAGGGVGSDPPTVQDIKPEEASSVAQKGGVVEVVTKAGQVVEVRGLQRLIIAEEWYQAANRGALAVVRTGVLPDAALVRLQKLNRTVIAAFERGRSAVDDVGKANAAAEAMAAVLDIRKLVGLK